MYIASADPKEIISAITKMEIKQIVDCISRVIYLEKKLRRNWKRSITRSIF